MSEELTVKSLRDRVSNAALSPDVKNELFTQLRYARTPEELAAIEARLTSAAPAPPTFKAPAETRTPLRTKFGKTPNVAYSARPSREFGGDFYSPLAADPSTVITALLDERGAFADDKPSQRRPFTRAAFNEVVRALEAGPGPSTSRALVGRIEQLDDALVRYSADRYAVHRQVSDSNKAAFAAAVSELHDQVNNYLSAAQRYVAAPEGAPKVKTASSSRAVLSESDPRFLEAEKARKRQPTAPSPFAKQARPIARSRRADVVRTVAEKGRLIPLQKAKGQSANARFAAVLVRFAPYGLYPQSKGRRKRGGAMPQRLRADEAQQLVERGRAALARYADVVDDYFDRRRAEARSPQGRYQLEAGKRNTLKKIATAERDLDKADALATEVSSMLSEDKPDPRYAKTFEQVERIVDRVRRDFGIPLGAGEGESEGRNNGDDFDMDFEDAGPVYEGPSAWLFDAVFQRYVFMYPLEFADAKDLIYKHRNTFVATQAKFLRRPVTPDINVHGHFIIDMERLFLTGSEALAQSATNLIDHAFMVDVPKKGYTFLHKAREADLLEYEKAEQRVQAQATRESMRGEAAQVVTSVVDAFRSLYGDEAATAQLERLEPRLDTRKGAANVGYVFFDALADSKRLERVRRTGVREPRPTSDPETEEVLAAVLQTHGNTSPDFARLVREQLASVLTGYQRKSKEARVQRQAAVDEATSAARTARLAEDEADRGLAALELTQRMIKKFGAAPFITRDWASTQPISYAKMPFKDRLSPKDPILKFVLDEAPKAVVTKDSTTPTILLQDTIVEFLKQIRANFKPSAKAKTDAKLTQELAAYVGGLAPADVPVVTATRSNVDESGEPPVEPEVDGTEAEVVTEEPFSDVPDLPPEAQIKWSSVVTVEPPPDRPVYSADFFIKDWLNSNHNFFGVVVDFTTEYFDYTDEEGIAPEQALEPFPVFGPHNIVTIAQYYRQYDLAPKTKTSGGIGAAYLGPTDIDDLEAFVLGEDDDEDDDEGGGRRRSSRYPPDMPRGFVLRIDYDNDAEATDRAAARATARVLRDSISTEPSDEVLPFEEVFKVQFIWPFASEPLTLTTEGFETGAYDATFGVLLAAFLWRQFDEEYENTDAVLQTVRADLNDRMNALEASHERVAPMIQGSIEQMYKMTGRIAALATWSQSTFVNAIDAWLDQLSEGEDAKEPWWLPFLVPNFDEIALSSNALNEFKKINFERRRDEVSAAWRAQHDRLSDSLAPLGRAVGFMHVPTVSVQGRTGARVATDVDLDKESVRWGRDVALRELSSEDYSKYGLDKEVAARFQAAAEPKFFTRFTVQGAEGEETTYKPAVSVSAAAKKVTYKMFDKVLQHHATMRDQIAALKKAYTQKYGTPQALRRTIQDPEFIQPRWDIPADTAQAAEAAFRAGGSQASFVGMNLNARAMRAATRIGFLSTALTATTDEQRETQLEKYENSLATINDDLDAAINTTIRNEIEPRLRTIYGDDPDAAIQAMEELYALSEQNPNNAVYNAALDWMVPSSPVGGRKAAAEEPDESEVEVDATEEEGEETPRENRQRRRRPSTLRPNRASRPRAVEPLPVLTPKEQRFVEQLRKGPALLIRQGVVLHMDNYGQSATSEHLRAAFRKVVGMLARKGYLDTAEGRPTLTEKGRRAEVDLIRQMLKQRKLLRDVVQGYDKYVRLVTARENTMRHIGSRIRQVGRQVPPPPPPPSFPRDNPSGFALSGKVTTRRMFDPRQGIEVQTPVVEYRPQVFQDPPTFKKGSRQHQNRTRTQPPYRPRIYLPVDPDHPTTQAFFEDTSRPTHDVIRQTLDWSTHEHAAGTNVETYAPDELIPMGRKWRGAGPRGAVVKPQPIKTQADMEREARQQAKEVEKARKTLAEQEELVKKAQERIAQGKKPTPKQQAALDAAGGASFAPPPAAPPRPASRPSTPVLTPVATPATVSTVALPSVDDDEFVTPASEAEIAAMFEKYEDAQLAQMREQNEMLRQRLAGSPEPVSTPKPVAVPAAKPVAELETPPAEGGVRRRRKQATEAAPEVEVDTSAYFVPAAVASGKQKLPADNLDIELGLAMTEREQGLDADYKQVVTTTRKQYGRIVDSRTTNLARQKAAAILLDVAEGSAMNFDALRPYASEQTIERLNILPPEAVQIAAQDMANLLRTLVSRANSAKVVADHNDGSSAYGPRFQGFRVR